MSSTSLDDHAVTTGVEVVRAGDSGPADPFAGDEHRRRCVEHRGEARAGELDEIAHRRRRVHEQRGLVQALEATREPLGRAPGS